MNALQRAAAYAVKPNELGRCGPHDAHMILNEYIRGITLHSEAEIRQLLSQFEVAMPNYQLVARANNIDDVFNERVIEAYWLGNELIEIVSESDVKSLITNDVEQAGWSKDQIALMFAAIKLKQAKPHHCLSVLYFYAFSSGRITLSDDFKRRMDSCRVACGRVIKSNQNQLTLAYKPLEFSGSIIVGLGSEITKEVDCGFIDSVASGDIVSFHLDFCIEKLDEARMANLEHYTRLTIASLCGK